MAEIRTSGSVPLREYAQVVLRRIPTLLAVAILVSVAVVGVGGRSGGRYSSTASVLVQPLIESPFSPTVRPDLAVSLPTETRLVTSNQVLTALAEDLDLRVSVAELRKRVTVANPVDTQILDITYRDANRSRAQRGAQSLADNYLSERGAEARAELADQRERLQSQVTDASEKLLGLYEQAAALPADAPELAALEAQQQLVSEEVQAYQAALADLISVTTNPGKVISAAREPVPTGRSLSQLAAVGIAAGLVLGLAAAFLRDSLHNRVWDASDLETAAQVPVLAVIRDDSSYREARTMLLARAPDARCVLLCGVSEGDQPWTSLLRLGTLFHLSGLRVLVIVGDRSGADLLTGLAPREPGLADVVLAGVPLDDARQETAVGLHVLPPGSGNVPMADLASLPAGREALKGLMADHDLTLIGTGAGGLATSLEFALLADGAVLVTTRRSTRHTELVDLVDRLGRVGTKVFGALIVERGRWGRRGRRGRAMAPAERAPEPVPHSW